RAGDETAVVPPVEANPGPGLPRLVLQVRRLVKLFVVVNSERQSVLSDGSSQTASLRWEEARGDARHHHQRRESVELRHAHANCKARDLGTVPPNRKEDWGRGQHAE